MSTITVYVEGLGAWGPGFATWPELVDAMASAESLPVQEGYAKGPKPEVIPSNERRRAPVSVKVAVESSTQAMAGASAGVKHSPCVFASGYGDMQLTDHICRVLTTDTKQVSPTKFHNSVHNASAGYWTISTGCHGAASSIAGLDWTAPLGLLEAATQCEYEQSPVLLTCFDIPVIDTLLHIMPNQQLFSGSLLLSNRPSSNTLASLSLRVIQAPSAWPELALNDTLTTLYNHNPAGRLLSVLKGLAQADMSSSVELPLNEHSSVRITQQSASSIL